MWIFFIIGLSRVPDTFFLLTILGKDAVISILICLLTTCTSLCAEATNGSAEQRQINLEVQSFNKD